MKEQCHNFRYTSTLPQRRDKHSKSKQMDYFSARKCWRKKCVYCYGKTLRQMSENHENSVLSAKTLAENPKKLPELPLL